MVFKPRRSTGILVGIAIIISLLALDMLLLSYLRWGQISLVFFVFVLLIILSLPLLAVLSYLIYGLFNLRYQLHRNALTITWGAIQHVIPMGGIREVARGKDFGEAITFRGVKWPGYLLGLGQIEGIGRTIFYATEPVPEQVLVITPVLAYGISPSEADGFLDAFEIRRQIGPIQLVPHERRQPAFLSWPIWGDRLAHLLLALGLVTNFMLFGYQSWRYPALGKADIFRFPAIGLVALIVNCGLGIFVHSRQRVGAYLLWGGAVVVQFLSWLVALSVIG